MMLGRICDVLKSWRCDERGVAATEAALVFPILMTMLLSLMDAGNGILANQKTIRSSQIVADLITRTNMVDDFELDDAIEAGALAFEPMSSANYGVDIVSVRFDENSNSEIVWRETRNMSAGEGVLGNVSAIAAPDSGVVMVTVEYKWKPYFSGFVFKEITMQEIAFARGRNTAVVGRI